MATKDRAKHDPVLAKKIREDMGYRRLKDHTTEAARRLKDLQVEHTVLGDKATVQDGLEFLAEQNRLSFVLAKASRTQRERLSEIVEEHYR